MRSTVNALLAAVAALPPMTAVGQSSNTYQYQTISPGNSYPYSTIGPGHSYSYSTIRPGHNHSYSTLPPTFRNLDEYGAWHGLGRHAPGVGLNGVGQPRFSPQVQAQQAQPQPPQRSMTREEAAAYLLGRMLGEAFSRR